MSAKPVNVEMSDPSRSKGMGDSGNEDNPFDDSDLSSGEGDENDKVKQLFSMTFIFHNLLKCC
jgi:hypothetical protein